MSTGLVKWAPKACRSSFSIECSNSVPKISGRTFDQSRLGGLAELGQFVGIEFDPRRLGEQAAVEVIDALEPPAERLPGVFMACEQPAQAGRSCRLAPCSRPAGA